VSLDGLGDLASVAAGDATTLAPARERNDNQFIESLFASNSSRRESREATISPTLNGLTRRITYP